MEPIGVYRRTELRGVGHCFHVAHTPVLQAEGVVRHPRHSLNLVALELDPATTIQPLQHALVRGVAEGLVEDTPGVIVPEHHERDDAVLSELLDLRLQPRVPVVLLGLRERGARLEVLGQRITAVDDGIYAFGTGNPEGFLVRLVVAVEVGQEEELHVGSPARWTGKMGWPKRIEPAPTQHGFGVDIQRSGDDGPSIVPDPDADLVVVC